MTTKWNVQLGDVRMAVSKDLLLLLGFESPYSNDETLTARDTQYYMAATRGMAEAVATGLEGDTAAMRAIQLKQERSAAQSLETARQKVAELEAKAAADHRAAEGMALARQRRASEEVSE